MTALPKPLEDLRLALDEAKQSIEAQEKESARLLEELRELHETALHLRAQLAAAKTDGSG